VPVCLHCGELAPEGALFCTKCGFTLPQLDASVSPNAPPGAPGARPGPAVGPPVSPPFGAPTGGRTSVGFGPVTPPGAYAYPAATVPGAVGPIPPPPNAKYCVRCGTLISRPAVYCPVCQSPQG
jgi:RNA polymerase subunit RPABC4/transcription elongation factor Spt4